MDQTSSPSQTMRVGTFSEDARINRLLAHIGCSLASGAILFEPNWLELSTPAWVEHLPFASWIVTAHRPRCLVELGTHFGNSYFGFCQSVAEQECATRCYAVDTWRGDAHSGQYDDNVFAAVNAHNQRHYAGFSGLLRCAFDEAVSHFPDNSIDLLHIDGLHTYEAVRHDFESWLPKLSDRAIVLFHDTNVRERDFGVHRFWSELTAIYPHFEFLHSRGLGVLGVGARVDEPLKNLFAAGTDDRLAAVLRDLFWRTAGTLRVRQLPGTAERELKAQRERTRLVESEYSRPVHEVALPHESANLLQREIQAARAEIARALGTVGHLDSDVLTHRTVKDLDREIQRRDARIRAVEDELRKVLTSEAWRMTAPLRQLLGLLRRHMPTAMATDRVIGSE